MKNKRCLWTYFSRRQLLGNISVWHWWWDFFIITFFLKQYNKNLQSIALFSDTLLEDCNSGWKCCLAAYDLQFLRFTSLKVLMTENRMEKEYFYPEDKQRHKKRICTWPGFCQLRFSLCQIHTGGTVSTTEWCSSSW